MARLHSGLAGTGDYEIVWEAFADTEANPSPEVVRGIAKRLGVSDFWPTISEKSGEPARWSDTALTSMLTDLITKRNECAHTGKVSPIPTTSEVLDFVDMLEVLSQSFVYALNDELARHAARV